MLPESHDRLRIDSPPDPHPRRPRRFALPRGATDSHAHVIGTSYIQDRSYTPCPATAEAYLSMLDTVGITYGVLVQVSVHGDDNSLMLRTLQANRQRLRGIAVIQPDMGGDVELAILKDAGVVGLRLNTTTRGGVGIAHIDRYSSICAELGWHLQLLVEPKQLSDLLRKVARLRVPLVIDHMGYVHAGAGMDAAREALIQLLEQGAWVKLSGSFRLSSTGPPYLDTVSLAKMLIEVAPDRCVWGSDWPHTNFTGPMPNPGDLLDLLADWAPDQSTRDAILTDNAWRLYGFARIA